MIDGGRIEVVSCTGRPDVAEVLVGRVDGRPERLVEFVDGLDVRFPRQDKWIVNVSTQYGCPVGCPFCDAAGAFAGNVPAEVMLEQVAVVLDRHPESLRRSCRKLKVHFARMGEPALNPAVPDAIEILPSLAPNPHLWACVATTCPRTTGFDSWFARLVEAKEAHFRGRFQFQLSVNSTDPAWRARLAPVRHAGLEDLAAIGEAFYKEGDRKVVLNFALAEGVPVEAAVIARHFDPEVFAVKLTPLNPTARGAAAGLVTAIPPAARGLQDVGADVASLVRSLGDAGYDVVVSAGDPREDTIGSNCGQAVRRLTARDDHHDPPYRDDAPSLLS